MAPEPVAPGGFQHVPRIRMPPLRSEEWSSAMHRIHVIHENPDWLPPLAEAFERRGLPWTEWFLSGGAFDLAAPPPEGVFYNRMSASSHTRGHRYRCRTHRRGPGLADRHGRRVVNGPRALDLEISKVRQYAALEAAGSPRRARCWLPAPERILAAAPRAFRRSAADPQAQSWREGARRAAVPGTGSARVYLQLSR